MKFKYLLLAISFITLSAKSICQSSSLIDSLNNQLLKGKTTISNILSDTALMTLHSLTPFREIIKTNARPEAIRIVSNNEPGAKIKILGHLLNKSGTPLTNKLVYIYQTSSEGWYSDTAPHIRQNEGDRRHARLFGYLKTDSKGDFEFFTIKPKGYPNSSLPAHIHLEVSLSADKFFISELQFDDDPRLVGEIRVRSIKENFLIAGNSGTKEKPIYSYTIQISN